MAAALVLAFLVLPVLEIYVIIQVGQVIGGWPTLALLVLESMLGAWIVRREGARAWRALADAISTARLPDRELADAGLILVGGTLLLTPGFVTDVAGFACVLPLTRPLMRALLAAAVRRRLLGPVRRPGRGVSSWGPTESAGPGPARGPAGRSGQAAGGAGERPRVIPGEVVDRRDEPR